MNRREFLNQVALGGVLAGISGRAVAESPRFSSGLEFESKIRKLVYISDIHLGADPGTAWINEHIGPLAEFLHALNSRPDVSELVILGDLLDDWLVPVDDIPITFQEIVEAPHNQLVIAALQEVCANSSIQVTYVTGNHDFLSFETAAKTLIEETFPGISICSDEPGLGAYAIDDILWSEHGHRYCLFNSPDIWSHPGSYLPLGYFVTRLAASQSEAEGILHTSPDVIERFIRANLDGLSQSADRDLLIAVIFNAIALWAGKNPDDIFVMNGKDGFVPNPSVADITRMYSPIMSLWSKRQNIVSPDMALLNELGYMINSAQLLFSMPRSIKKYYPFTPRIVLFGHTHKPLLWQRMGFRSTIYANSGTWIDGKPMTWVEVDIRDLQFSRRSYTVSLWYRGQSTASKTGTIVVTRNKI